MRISPANSSSLWLNLHGLGMTNVEATVLHRTARRMTAFPGDRTFAAERPLSVMVSGCSPASAEPQFASPLGPVDAQHAAAASTRSTRTQITSQSFKELSQHGPLASLLSADPETAGILYQLRHAIDLHA